MSKRLDEIEARLLKIEKDNDGVMKILKESLQLIKEINTSRKVAADRLN
jgi:Iap family predicted aminopeptidase